MADHAQPKARILELYGAFGRRVGGWVAVADLITLLAEFGIEETAIRSACSRMKARGMLVPERRGGVAGYCLSDAARTILADGDARIYHGTDQPDDDGWVLCVFSVPEQDRSDRYLIRSRLSWLGFGQASPGVFMAPRALADEARRMLDRLDLARWVTLWEADYVGDGDLAALVAEAWDLDALRAVHCEYLEAHGPVLARWRDRTGRDADPARHAFHDYLESLSHWRRLPYLDPGLPGDLLPEDWPAADARRLFNDLVEALQERAFDHFRTVVG